MVNRSWRWTAFLSLSLVVALSWSYGLAEGSAFSLNLGPPSVGTGGSNALAIPPQFTDMSLTYITDAKKEFHLGITGLYGGTRIESKWGTYLSWGIGLVINANGVGFGPYSLFGYEIARTEGGFYATIEYFQAIGLTDFGVISPYVIRIGLGKWF